jgi:hypothetical protein
MYNPNGVKGKMKFQEYDRVKLKEDFIYKADGISIVFHKGDTGIVVNSYVDGSELEFRNPTAKEPLFMTFG